jgi:hypothetical protein
MKLNIEKSPQHQFEGNITQVKSQPFEHCSQNV